MLVRGASQGDPTDMFRAQGPSLGEGRGQNRCFDEKGGMLGRNDREPATIVLAKREEHRFTANFTARRSGVGEAAGIRVAFRPAYQFSYSARARAVMLLTSGMQGSRRSGG